MHRTTIRIVTLIVLATVMFVFVAPLVDLEPSALRAQQFAQFFLAALVSGALLFSRFSFQISQVGRVISTEPPGLPLQDLICVRLC